MKKIISALLSVAMILSLMAAICIPASAVEGDWIAYSNAGEYREDFEGDLSSVIGYEYTPEGLTIIPADWKDFNVSGGLQTKTKYDVKEGIYMLVRIDDFAWDAGDKWFNINLWSDEMVQPGNADPRYGEGVQTLVRTDENGNIHTLWWHVGPWDAGTQSSTQGTSPKDENGKLLLEFTVTWDGTTFAANINGWEAPANVIKYMNETYADMDAFVGFNFMAGKKDDNAQMTILKFGTDKESAITPSGDDRQEPVNYYSEIAEIASPDTVEEGQPAVLLNGSREFSDAKSNTGISGNIYRTRNDDDWSVTYLAANSIINASYTVANAVSYDIQDFPLAVVLVRNYCSCEEENGEVICYACEKVWAYIMTGEFSSADDDHKVQLEPCYEPIVDEEGNSYLYFFVDMSGEDAPWDAEGRIHGMRADFYDIYYNQPGRNTLDVCFMAFFRNLDDAEAYIYDYIGVEMTEDTTEEITEESTEERTEESTEERNEGTTEETTEKTTAKAEGTTTAGEEQTTAAPADNDDKRRGGCGSVVGFGAVAIVTVTAVAGCVSFRKKKD